MPRTGVSQRNRAPVPGPAATIASRAAPDAIRPPPAWNTTVPEKRIPGQRSLATSGVSSSTGTPSASSAARTRPTPSGSPWSTEPVRAMSATFASCSSSDHSASASAPSRTQNGSG